MSSRYPTTINAAIAAIFEHIAPNNNGEIDALKLRGVLMDILLGIYDTFARPDDALLSQFPAYDPFNEYEGGTEVVVSYNDRLWLFVSPMDSTGQFPGTNAGVWQPFNVLGLAHFKNLDTWLDKPGPFAVSAQQLREHLEDETIHQVHPVQLLDVTLTVSQITNGYSSPVELLPDPPDGFFRDFIDLKAVQVPVDENPLQPYDDEPAHVNAVITNSEDTILLNIDLSHTVYVQRSVSTRWDTFTANAAILFRVRVGNPAGGNFKIRILGHFRLIPIDNE